MLETRVKVYEAKVWGGLRGKETVVEIHHIDHATVSRILDTCKEMDGTGVKAKVGEKLEGRVSFKPDEGELYIHIPNSEKGFHGMRTLYDTRVLPEAVREALNPTYESWTAQYK